MVLNVKLMQIIANIDFLCIFQQKENFWGNLTSGCHGNALVGLMSNSTNLAKITLCHMTIPKKITNSKEDPLSYILHETALKYLNSNQNDSSRSETIKQ